VSGTWGRQRASRGNRRANFRFRDAAYTVAELPIGNFLVRSPAPSRIRRPGSISAQTAAEKSPSEACSSVQCKGGKFGTSPNALRRTAVISFRKL
jgi:hypothetical protein